MASTYSSLKFELITTGEQSGTWGDTTNTNIGTAIQEAITGSADVTFSSGTVTLSLTDTNNTQTARNLRLNLTGTSGGAQNLIVPAIEKQYIVYNGCADTITIKNSTGTGVAVPAGKTMVVFNNGTNVVDVTTHATSLTLGSALPVTSGGTGVTTSTGTGNVVLSNSPTLVTPALGTPASGTLTNCNGLPVATGISGLGSGVATFLATPSSSNLAAAVSDETGSGALVFANSPTLVTPALGTPSSGTLTSCTGLPLTTGVTGTLPVANGGTGVTTSTGSGSVVLSNSPTLVTPALGTPSSGTLTNCTGLPLATGVSGLGSGVATFLATPSSANLAAAVTGETGSGALVFATSPTLVTPALGTPSSGTLTSCTGLPLTTGVTGTLPVANGGTGATSITSGALIKGAGTGAFSAASASDITSAIGSTAVTNATNASNATSGSTLASQTAKAWVRFDGVAGVSINASYNVSSVTRTASGKYTVNFSNALADANYSFTMGSAQISGFGNPQGGTAVDTGVPPTASAFSFNTLDNTYNSSDSPYISAIIYR